MPTYEYECNNCGTISEIFHGINEVINPVCETCAKQDMRRLISGGIGVHFKGSGFYATDTRKSETKSKPDTKKTSDATKSKD